MGATHQPGESWKAKATEFSEFVEAFPEISQVKYHTTEDCTTPLRQHYAANPDGHSSHPSSVGCSG